MTRNNEVNDHMPALVNGRLQEDIATPSLPNTTNIRNYFEEDTCRNNSGHVDNEKAFGNVRMLSLNPHGCRPTHVSKINMLKQAIEKFQIDVML